LTYSEWPDFESANKRLNEIQSLINKYRPSIAGFDKEARKMTSKQRFFVVCVSAASLIAGIVIKLLF
jgi:hypothetical protein